MQSSASARVAVVGSVNLDHVLEVARLPAPGATVSTSDYHERGGGKGANQAAAAARAGGSVTLIASVGSDESARGALADLDGVMELRLHRGQAPTGRAFVLVDTRGENSIVVVAGANAELGGGFVASALEETQPDVVLAQLEVDGAAVRAAAAWAERNERRFVLNPSPVMPLGPELLAECDPLIVNEAEARELLALAGLPAHTGDAVDLARLLASVCRSVVVTAGADGAAFATSGDSFLQSAEPADVVDTTGAGDAFAGTLAVALSAESDVRAAMAVASSAAGRATTWVGARPLKR